MILLDSNVLSALMADPPDERVERWLNRQPWASVWTTSITIFELYFGLELLPTGRRRARLAEILEQIVKELEDRIAGLDSIAAQRTAELMAARQKQGRPRDLRDTLIAGIALACHATLATRNTTHFEDAGIPLINPWKA